MGASPRVKRAIDVVGSVILILFAALPMGACALAILATTGRPVLYVDERPGRDGRHFRLRKFRTMRPAIDGEDVHSRDRVTAVGRWLRATSLDELPQLFNVLLGEMSLVGPRPLLPEYLGRYTAEQARRHEVRPGVTGLAQVQGRTELSWERTFELDVWYVDHWSVHLDLAILARTVLQLLTRTRHHDHTDLTREAFTGHPAPPDGGTP